ncbi:class I SAM-dependent DNA methyltransferase [Amaricoccus tamworthensis]|uniref:class I SAM-dependent DNA methyltransferase n=1 Tax=Amaricoccus tamworthensis TaxID=57002 RepID=UPI003C7AEC3D
MSDARTLKIYGERFQDYASRFGREKPDADLQAFMDELPQAARVLDLGCGPGHAAAFMAQAGLTVEAWDATPAMVEMAGQTPGVAARLARFDDLDAEAHYDGIWANFSLLHAPRADMPANLARIARALKSQGLFHLGLKAGEGERRDKIGRFYSYFGEDELRDMLAEAGFEITALRRGSSTGLDGTTSPFIILRARRT